ncbi:TnsD family Tn7-like transposition protein [Paraburkholderia terrae]|uniref:TnsD family Tn7-like transposition protein n=1 Tax=Paraburkholderia terrae TaxID=311230 RepID=UPI0037CAFC70
MRILSLKGERTATLRYCEECLTESLDKQQAPYWRIDHQLAGVYCCFRHGSILKSVQRSRYERYFDQTVLRLVIPSDERVLQRTTLSEKCAVEDVAKRSGQQRAEGRACKSTEIYLDMIKEAGFVRANSRINHQRFVSAWMDYFGHEYCHVTGMTAAKVSKWLDRLSGNQMRSECPHPFMFIAAESFLERQLGSPGSYLPQISCKDANFAHESGVVESVRAGYSCKGALHRNTDVLELVSMRSGRWKLVCTCGISYRTVRADQSDGVRLIPILYGARYRNRFCALIAKGANLSSAAQTLRLSMSVGSRWALGERVGDLKLLPLREIIKLRAKWRWLVRNAPPAGPITAATKADPAVYKALWKNDADWLRTFNRSHRSPGRTKGAVRLKEPTPDQIREAWRGLMSAEPPIMATRRAILQRAGFFRTMGGNRSFEPVLVKLVECRPAYLERVISWLASLASGQQLSDCEEAIRTAGLRKSRFSKEQRERIRAIELMSSVEVHTSHNR